MASDDPGATKSVVGEEAEVETEMAGLEGEGGFAPAGFSLEEDM